MHGRTAEGAGERNRKEASYYQVLPFKQYAARGDMRGEKEVRWAAATAKA